MKLNPDGTLEGSPEELAAYKHIDAALSAKNSRGMNPKPKKPREAKVEKVEEVEVSPMLAETLDLLSAHDGPVPASQIATEMGIKPATAQWRLNKLAALGLVHKPSRGMYSHDFMLGEK